MSSNSNTNTSGITSNLENENENRNDNTSGNGCNENGDENVNSDEMDDSTDEDYESPEEIRMKEAEEKQRKLDDQKYEIRRGYNNRSYTICQQGESLPSSLKYGSTIEDNKEYKMPIYYSLIYSIYDLYTLCYPRQRKWYRFSLMKKKHYLLRLQLWKHIQKWLLVKIMIYVVKRNVLSYYKNHLEMIS